MKKLLTLLLAVICIATCAFSLAACNDENGSEMIWLYAAKSDETPNGTSIGYTVPYGQTPDLSNYKLYGFYGKDDNDKPDLKEISLTDEKLSVKYYYIPFGGNDTNKKEMSALPAEWLAGNYTIEYVYGGNADLKAEVNISVERAQSGAFGIQPAKSTWYANEKTANVVLKNPKGLAVAADEHGSVTKKSDDSNGYYFLHYIKKEIYDSFTEAQKTDYEYMQNYLSEYGDKGEYNAGLYLPGYNDVLRAGEWMIFAMIDGTYNYWNVVTPAAKITVKNPIIERTFTFQSVSVQDSNGNPVTDEENEFVIMAKSFNTENLGKTVICKTNGEVRGTVDFGAGKFDELTDEDLYEYNSATNDYFALYQNNEYAGEGNLSGNTLTLKVSTGTSYYFIITFIGQ